MRFQAENAAAQLKRFFRRLRSEISRVFPNSGNRGPAIWSRAKPYLPGIGDNAVDLVVQLALMVLVERTWGREGLGIYSYLISLYILFGNIAEVGVPRMAEKDISGRQRRGDTGAAQILNARRAVFLSGCTMGILFIFSSGFDAAHTGVGEGVVAYLLIGLALPVRNWNELRFALLNGLGHHDKVAKIKIKRRLVTVGGIIVMLMASLPPSLLMAALLAGEIAALRTTDGILPRTRKRELMQKPARTAETIRASFPFFFADDALDFIFYADFFILGLFVPSWELGVYAEASILAKCFLIIPIGIKPVLRRRYCAAAGNEGLPHEAAFAANSVRLLFLLQSLFGLYLLMHFNTLLQTFFETRGEEMLSFRVFTVLLPGLLFFSTLLPQEPLYEAAGEAARLRTLSLRVAIVNLALNFYLVPFAGLYGAAAATSCSMGLYFLLFGHRSHRIPEIPKNPMLIASSAMYLTYLAFRHMDVGVFWEILLIPVFLAALMYATGFFETRTIKNNP